MKEVYLSGAEMEIVNALRDGWDLTEIEARQKVIEQKRQLRFLHQTKGDHALVRQLSKELGDWTDEAEEQYQTTVINPKKIILL